ncbi:MAG: nitrogenase component 1 [Desulfuromonadales bacterium]
MHDLRRAQLSLVFSPWGLDAARELEARFGIPWINLNFLPVGAEESARLFETVAEALILNLERINRVNDDLRKREGHFLNKLADAYYIQGWQLECAIVADSSTAPGIATFLAKTLGLLPSLVIITDNPADQNRLELAESVDKLLPGFGTRILFCEDQGEISDALLQRAPEIILGSSLEQDVAHRLHIPLVEISFPVTGQVELNKCHAGLRGALALLEDVGRAILLSQSGDIS